MDIWHFSRVVSLRLFLWNILNALVGLFLARRSLFWRGVGSQNVGWAFINLMIAVVGGYFTQRRLDRLHDPYGSESKVREARNLYRLLWINAGLDVLYMITGGFIAVMRGGRRVFVRGIGVGIIVQGFLLFVFDIFHAMRIPPWTR